MGTKLLWIGLTLIIAFPLFGLSKVFVLAGAIIMTIGCVLNWFDK